ncbi:MAG: phosphoribosylamine--glycine ligase, partial [Akkermansiaceae bacterium]|nr:phosphoribosylamine--glycine ligase [Akkermansiaceae bacterium]
AGDLAEFCFAGAKGDLRNDLIQFSDGWSVCVILASAGYPETSRNGDKISGLEKIHGARIYHSGTRLSATGEWETNGGRVLAVVAGGPTRAEAVIHAHEAADSISFEGLQRRRDIGILNF